MNVNQRPNPVLATRRERVTVPFGPIKSPLLLAMEAREQVEGDTSQFDEIIQNFEAEGMTAWSLSGTLLQRLPGVEGHAVADLTERLSERFVTGDEGLPGVDFEFQKVTLHLCRNVALVHTVIVTLDGGDPYSPEELLALAHNLEDCWSALLFEVLTKVTANPTSPTGKTSG